LLTHRSWSTRLSRIEWIWELRGRLTAYDAAYVALAEGLAVPFVTMDGRLARAAGHRAQIIVFEA
jgi:predicted nucleic acid-binding protein